ncbi:MAG: hypothetical protein GY759_03210 [Chloroflexi bacterium]|nr:hypothetical protein [Chloroflexota bacterium]
MRNFKRFFRWLMHKVSVALLANAIAFGIPLFAFGIHVTDPQIMKDWLSEANSYETLVDRSLDLIELEASNASSQGSLGDSLAGNPFVDSGTVVDALRSTLTPEFIQTQAEGFIDGAYEWLDSENEVPQFEFSLAEKNDELSQKLGDALKEQFANMPECLPEELSPEFNLLETICQPPGIDISSEVDLLVAQLAGKEGLLSNATWTGEDMVREDGDEGGGLSPGQVDFAKSAFGGLKNGPMYLMIAGLVAIPLVFYSSRSQYRGYNEIGNTLFSGSLFTFIPAVVIARWENIITSLVGATDETSTSSIEAVRALFEPFLELAVNDIASLTAWLSGVTLVLGSMMVGYGFYLRRIYEEQEEDDIAAEIAEAKEQRRIKEVKAHAKRRARHKDKTLDPKTKKPLKANKKVMAKDLADGIANDPYLSSKPIVDLDPAKVVKDVNERHLGDNPTKPSPRRRK